MKTDTLCNMFVKIIGNRVRMSHLVGIKDRRLPEHSLQTSHTTYYMLYLDIPNGGLPMVSPLH